MAPKKKRPQPIDGLQNMGHLTDFHTGMIYGLYLAQSYGPLSQEDIAHLMGVARPTVADHIDKAKGYLEVAVAELPSPEKPRQPSAEPDPVDPAATDNEAVARRRELVKKMLGEKNKLGFRVYRTARDVQEFLLSNMEVSLRTIQRDCQLTGFPYRVRTMTSPLTAERAAKRVEFCKQTLRTYTDAKYNRICFSDESYIRCEDMGRGMRVAEGEEPEPRRVDRYSKKKIYVWGAIGVGYRKLVFLEGYTNCEDYRDTLRNHYFNDHRTRDHIFMQDGAPPHRGHKIPEWIQSQRPMLENWPPYSPDLNPIENLWGDMKMSVKVDVFTEIDELKAGVLEFWNNLNQDYIDELVLSFPEKLQKCVDLEGECVALKSKHPLFKKKPK
jgi:transposase